MAQSLDSDQMNLQAQEILKVEFNYIEKTVFQANEDRARVSSYFLSAAGSLIAVILGAHLKEGKDLSASASYGFSMLFVVLGITGCLTILQLVRLRRAWRESVQAMLKIKKYYLDHFAGSDLNEAFLWRDDTLPAAYKPGSISFLLAVQVAIMSGVMFGAAYYFFAKAQESNQLALALFIGFSSLVAEMVIYRVKLK